LLGSGGRKASAFIFRKYWHYLPHSQLPVPISQFPVGRFSLHLPRTPLESEVGGFGLCSAGQIGGKVEMFAYAWPKSGSAAYLQWREKQEKWILIRVQALAVCSILYLPAYYLPANLSRKTETSTKT